MGRSVMVAQGTLTPYVQVQVLVSLPSEAQTVCRVWAVGSDESRLGNKPQRLAGGSDRKIITVLYIFIAENAKYALH